MPRIQLKSTRSSWGYYDKGKIVLSKRLSIHNVPSKAYVLNHETYHKWVDDVGVVVPDCIEESAADLYAICYTPDHALSFGDIVLKKRLIRKRKPTKQDILKLARRYI